MHQAAGLQLCPQRIGDGGMQRRQIAGHFRHTLTAGNDRDHGRMPQRELKSSIDQPHKNATRGPNDNCR